MAAGCKEVTYYLKRKLEGKSMLVDLRNDVLLLKDEPYRSGAQNAPSSLSVLIRWLDGGFIRRLERLALPYNTWCRERKDRRFC